MQVGGGEGGEEIIQNSPDMLLEYALRGKRALEDNPPQNVTLMSLILDASHLARLFAKASQKYALIIFYHALYAMIYSLYRKKWTDESVRMEEEAEPPADRPAEGNEITAEEKKKKEV